MEDNQLIKIRAAYEQYTHEKGKLDDIIIENNRWFRQQQHNHNAQKEPKQPDATSGYIFSAINVKHADAMDNYPEINVLPREEADQTTAKTLTSILPCVMELCGFKKVYADCWWQKLKTGTGVYGVFWNPELQNGLGDIEIKKAGLLNLAWEPNVDNIQDSKYLFYTYYMDKDAFVEQYGKEKLDGSEDLTGVSIKSYKDMPQQQRQEKMRVVDCYYKEDKKVHLLKFSGSNILQDSKEKQPEGLYEHGMYPFVFDVMFPNEDSPAGFGIIDVVKSPQAYIDKIDSIISENAIVTGKKRWFIKDNGGVNEDEFLDINNPLVHVAGNLDEYNMREIPDSAMPNYIIEHRVNKINELKEVAGNRDFQQGGTSNGVTAASAINVLQQAGDKLTRDMVNASYESYKDIVYMCIELIRQFYDLERRFRIIGENGEAEFVPFSNATMKPQPVDSVLNQPEMAGLPAEDGMAQEQTENTMLRRPEFDISLTVQKANPFNKAQQNQTILEIWGAGFFNPQNIDMACMALDFMQFDGSDEIVAKLREMGGLQQQMAGLQQQLQQAQAQLQQMGQQNQQLQAQNQQMNQQGQQLQAAYQQAAGEAQTNAAKLAQVEQALSQGMGGI
ncbi:MAG: hypothetical protein HFI90_07035 [Clostridia bacterium]|nr:hypothetical protein [Clostridia bacterium]